MTALEWVAVFALIIIALGAMEWFNQPARKRLLDQLHDIDEAQGHGAEADPRATPQRATIETLKGVDDHD